jgi:hypothetical protein
LVALPQKIESLKYPDPFEKRSRFIWIGIHREEVVFCGRFYCVPIIWDCVMPMNG